MKNDMNEIGKRIVKRREELGLSQAKLARMINMEPSSLCRYESGLADIKVSVILEIAEALKTSPSYLIEGEYPEKETDNQRVLEAFNGIEDKAVKESVIRQIRALNKMRLG